MPAVKIKKLHPAAIVPEYSHEGDSGMDLFALESCTVEVGCRALVKTGISMEIPEGYEGQVRSKSGLALKRGIMVLNSPGTIDSNYRGEICVILYNTDGIPYHVEKGKKIAQLVISKVERAELLEVETLTDTSRAEGGFGSTGLDHK